MFTGLVEALGRVERVTDGGRTVDVVTEAGELLHFRLTGSGHFVSSDRSCRLIVE